MFHKILLTLGVIAIIHPCFAKFTSQGEVHALIAAFEKSQDPEKSHKMLSKLGQAYGDLPPMGQRALPPFVKYAYDYRHKTDADSAIALALSLMAFHSSQLQHKNFIEKILTPYAQSSLMASLILNYIKDPYNSDLVTSIVKTAQSDQEQSFALMAKARICQKEGNTPLALMLATRALYDSYSRMTSQEIIEWATGRTHSGIYLTGKREEDLASLRKAMDNSMPTVFNNLFNAATAIDLTSRSQAGDTAKSKGPIHICIGFDNNYAPHAATTMMSAMMSAYPTTEYVFHVLQDSAKPLTEANKQKFRDMMDTLPGNQFTVEFDIFDRTMISEDVLNTAYSAYWTPIIFFKLYMQDIYPDLDRIMWLDSDIIVREDLSELFHMDMQNHWIAGTRDICANKYLNRLEKPIEAHYINVGMVVFDNVALRKNECSQIISDFLGNIKDPANFLKLPEQDVFAMTYGDHMYELEFQSKLGSAWNWHEPDPYVPTNWSSIHSHPSALMHLLSPRLKPWHRSYRIVRWFTNPKMADGPELLYWTIRSWTPWAVKDPSYDS